MTDENVDTDIVIDDEVTTTTETPVYTFTITEQTQPDYIMTRQILEWIHTNMDSLVDDYTHKIFGKVNFGFNENTIKTFGKKPVCDVYVRRVEYEGTFDKYIPIKVHSIVLFYLKGANNQTYLKGCELHDYIMQEFITNEEFKHLPDVVRNTYITDSEIRNQNIRGGYGVMGAFELTHDLY